METINNGDDKTRRRTDEKTMQTIKTMLETRNDGDETSRLTYARLDMCANSTTAHVVPHVCEVPTNVCACDAGDKKTRRFSRERVPRNVCRLDTIAHLQETQFLSSLRRTSAAL